MRWCAMLGMVLAGFCPLLQADATLDPPACRDPIDFEKRLARFIDDAQAVTRAGPGLDDAQRGSAGAALQALAARMGAQRGEARTQLCAAFEHHAALFDAFAQARLLATAQLPAPAAGPPGLPSCMSPDTYLALFISSQASKAIAIVLKQLSDASSCPAYTGTIVCAPVEGSCTVFGPLAAVAEAASVATKIPLELDDRCRSDRMDIVRASFAADTNARLGAAERDLRDTLQPRIDAVLGTRAAAASVVALDTAVATGFTRLGDRVAALEAAVEAAGREGSVDQTADSRLSIELALSQGASGVASLQLPASAGGQLERVREAVAASILGLQALGEDMRPALALFAQGDAALNARDYRTAYARFQSAYRAAATGGTP